MRLVFRYLFIFLSIGAFAAEVVQIGNSNSVAAVSHDPFRRWEMGDSVCVYQGGRELSCGNIVKVTDSAGILRLQSPNSMVKKGLIVRLSKSAVAKPLPAETSFNTFEKRPNPNTPYTPQRKPSALLLQSVPKEKEASNLYHNLSGGFSVGNGFYFPLIHFQRAVNPQIALGIMPSYFSVATGSGTLSALALTATANYYGHDFFRGLWLQGGLGASFLSTTNAGVEQQATSFMTILTVGWRGYWDLGLNIGVCGGIQYLNDPNFNNVRLSGSGLQPLALIDVGINF